MFEVTKPECDESLQAKTFSLVHNTFIRRIELIDKSWSFCQEINQGLKLHSI